MRISKIHKYQPDKKEKAEYISVDIRPEDYYDDLEMFEDPKEFRRFLIRLKYLIRNSYEYKKLIKFLKYSKNMDYCGIHNNIKARNGYRIEIHHTPFVLEDIAYVVINKRLQTKEDVKMSSIAHEVMKLHYAGLVGLYPLCETCHEYAHGEANDLFIPLDNIWGDPVAFYDIYKEYFPEQLADKFENVLELNKGYQIMQGIVPEGLIRNLIYINNVGDEDSDFQVPSNAKLIDFLNSI